MPDTRVTIRRLLTGVPGLDEVIGGGLPEFSFNVIAGPPGSGKTTLAHQIMFALATSERPALYFTVLGEPPLKMLRYQQQFRFFNDRKINDSIRFVNLTEEMASGHLDKVLARIAAEVEAHAPALVFVDSFRTAHLTKSPESGSFLALQDFLQHLGLMMTSWEATTFLIGEYSPDVDSNPMLTVADGLIWLRQTTQRNSIVRKLEVMKMRGQPSLSGLHTVRIDAGGLTVFAPSKPGKYLRAASPVAEQPRLLMGVPGLDEMMGGGLPQGYSLLVAGPSGSGKSILASAFLLEGARQNDAGLIVSFERRPLRSTDSGVVALIDAGRIGVIDIQSSDLSVDEIGALATKEIRRLRATRVVIDSLSGFELALAPSYREDFRESLARLVSSLATEGVSVLMTSELEDRYNDLRFSPYGTAFLTDAIIVQRYVEIESRLARVMAVVKVRGSVHSHDLRQFQIDGNGIRIGERLTEQEGLLGGRPTRTRHASRPVEKVG